MRTPGPARESAPRISRAVALGLLQGPCELLPISSSGHLTLVPWLLGRPGAEIDPELVKALEVALHAGTAVALLAAQRGDVAEALGELTTRRLRLIVLSFLPPAAIGLLLERPIEQRLGTPATIAGGLLAGSAAMAIADRLPQRRDHREADAVDALALGAAQACALIPGVSRNGATLAAARWRGFRRPDAERLSRHVALPVIVGAASLKLVRLRNRRQPAGTSGMLLAGAAASCASTLAAARVLGRREPDRSLLPFAAYRTALAIAVLLRVRTGMRSGPPETMQR